MLSRRNRILGLKALSLISIVRGYNIGMIALAQYLASIFILSPDLPLSQVIFDHNLFIIVFCSALVIAGGYIINNFYDSEKDLINKPSKTLLERLVPQRTKIYTYFILNLLGVLFAAYVSFRAALFFAAYIFGIWFYSHRLKRITFVGNFVSATLAITPFFAVFIYYKNFEPVIFMHAIFLFLLILSRELIKDMENITGDLAQNYRTIAVRFGPEVSKRYVTLLIILALVPAYFLIVFFEVGYMNLYFIASSLLLLLFLLLMWRAHSQRQYIWLHNILKFVIVSGVFGILLIDIDLVLNRIL
ncbi:geranylgeranylglycerol-phosphate geranylgeranyltransferase [Robiginitalea sp.]|nr:geranylgeranylglycerol-phosphate geranylgeranyltransferase [Robiginitalea sp.]